MPSAETSLTRKNVQRRRAFTLIELLVVVALIALLSSLLLPAVNRAVYLTELTRCQSNMKQAGYGYVALASDNLGRFKDYAYIKPTDIMQAGADSRPDMVSYLNYNKLACP